MKQAEIKALLEETAMPDCTPERRAEIREALTRATAAFDYYGRLLATDGPAAGIRFMVQEMFDALTEERPQLLPIMFPFFAMACGDREPVEELAEIEWFLMT